MFFEVEFIIKTLRDNGSDEFPDIIKFNKIVQFVLAWVRMNKNAFLELEESKFF